ncbi:23S rRNA (adenine(2503)-C(2))-methyltransferase RlmN [Campylobacter canadensis]|uniref:23S rRNA (adenine(2503)-C(2))-methyltransferase RlmN n=1 Tax=Campylobacter canadensis TaxID=449520 RepID=UPI001557CFD3|nr:23S rRNA (adenine(2503)-C(2))-methyltransferase RlmN [Campylobacter canadensis]MBZ7994542.1 23S rRNA (adenine(2503)-C(2))-methyltransferase RlmN [Campylobacter canadensis]MBZ7997101.1 23S rRNA (adenine(2503)-C(2))-methyltransferase RlmN [Campylobacter canadensis]MBZ7999873.1 23S rRNA (adenine(2503)-C(2))-methyltransferase RlmN [Campylobacter canadensis]MBZ8001799.1 23S rRNA (adenine(2503)-C(2))-methyltransferase RlmN [Campylobacter canadensis]MBZ8004434.1 23S rRNA (adenine(2503)-C(2))-methy
MKEILDYLPEEYGLNPSFNNNQLAKFIYQKYINDFDEATSLSKDLRAKLKKEFNLMPLKLKNKQISIDKSIKFLFELNDKHTVESVLLPMKQERVENGIKKSAKYTICISSQVGCKSGCSFCLTGKSGLIRNLSSAEIVAQVLFIKKYAQIPYEHGVNIVFMGMGEPLDNLNAVAKAVKILAHNDTLAISPRRQTISTSGLAKQIIELGKMNLGVLLAISLHAVNDELRDKLMPINKAYNIKSVLDAIRQFPIDARKRVMFEYLCLGGINDDISHAKALVKLLHGIKAKINLIYFNPHKGSEYKRPSEERVIAFRDYLQAHGQNATIRQSKGLDISAACGQLQDEQKRLEEVQ